MENNNLAVIEYPVTEQVIEALRDQYESLVIIDLQDKAGYDKVEEARKHVKGLRIAVENRRVELKAEALSFGRAVDEKARNLTDLLLSFEKDLRSKSAAIDLEKEKIKKQKEAAKFAHDQERIYALNAIKVPFVMEYLDLSDELFTQLIVKETANFKAEQLAAKEKKDQEIAAAQAKAKEEAELKAKHAEELRVAKEAADLERARRAEENRIAEEKRIAEAKITEERVASEKAIRDQEARIAKEKQDAANAEIKRLQDEILAKQKAELEAKEKIEKEAAIAKAAEDQKIRNEEILAFDIAAKASKEASDKQLLEDIKIKFPTLEACWKEIYDLTV